MATITVAELGGLDTWWRYLGIETARAAVGRDVFRGRDSFSVIQHACLPDSRDVQAVAYFTREEAAGLLEPRITLVCEDLDTGPNYRIADRNHQAVPIFELARTRGTQRPVRVFLVGELDVQSLLT